MDNGDTVFLGAAECIYVEEARLCTECGTYTHFVEICFETPFCSEFCLRKWDDEYWAAIYENVYPVAWERCPVG